MTVSVLSLLQNNCSNTSGVIKCSCRGNTLYKYFEFINYMFQHNGAYLAENHIFFLLAQNIIYMNSLFYYVFNVMVVIVF